MRPLFAGLMIFGLSAGMAQAADKKADEIIKEIESLKSPTITQADTKDRAKVTEYLQAMQQVMTKRAELVGELYKVDPENERLVQLLPQRWQGLMRTPGGAQEIAKEAKDIKAKTKNDKLKAEAGFFVAYSGLMSSRDAAAALPGVEEFAKEFPKDPRAPQLLYMISRNLEDDAKVAELLKKIAKDYPDSQVARSVQGSLKQIEGVGKPFAIEFTDAINGKKISSASLKGTIYVVDFWATWCGPCVAEMPKMKELYAKYKDQGVEFVGVSLDQPKEKGGLDALKKYVETNEIGWPQYYQGNYWQSEFSSSWGVNSIPCVFIVDADGILHSVKARGKLDKLIPELIAKRKKNKA